MFKKSASILFVGLLSAYSFITFDLYQPSLPFITNYFDTTHDLAQLTLSIYLFVFGATQLIWGPLIDHFGRKRLLPGSLLLAFVSSILCVYAPNITVLIIGRALQGLALCCANLIAYSTARDYEDVMERAETLSYVNMINSISPILAPVLGSLVFMYSGWQANFVLMALIAIILWFQSLKILTESPFWTPPQGAFQLKKAYQSYKDILPSPILWCASMIMMFSFAAVLISITNSSYLIIDRLGFSPLGFGILFTLNGLNIIFGNYLGIWLREKLSMTTAIYLGAWSIVFGGVCMLLVIKYYGLCLFAFSFSLVANLGISICAAPTMSIALINFKNNTGTTLAFINTMRVLGSSIIAMIVGYWLVKDLYVFPLGLIGTGIGTLVFSYYFKRLHMNSTEFNLETASS